MKVIVKTDKEGSEMKILTQSQSTQLVRFSRNNAADKLTQYEGTSPYHLNYCGYESCPAGYAFGPHQRSSYLIHLVTKGYGTYYTKSGAYIAKEEFGIEDEEILNNLDQIGELKYVAFITKYNLAEFKAKLQENKVILTKNNIMVEAEFEGRAELKTGLNYTDKSVPNIQIWVRTNKQNHKTIFYKK